MLAAVRRARLLAALGAGLILLFLLALKLSADRRLRVAPRPESSSSASSRVVVYETSPEDEAWAKSRLRNDSSAMGRWLLSRSDLGAGTPPKGADASTFLILVWKHGQLLERRHLKRFSRDRKYSPWEGCSVSNCELSYDPADLERADAVLFLLQRTPGPASLPLSRRLPGQRWVVLSDESPRNLFLKGHSGKSPSLADYDGLFNWTMSYRMSSDVPVPYGRTVRLERDAADAEERLVAAARDKPGLVAILASNCRARDRWDYVRQLKRILGPELDILGSCEGGDRTACPGHFERDCAALRRYKFYLAFENSDCREYLSEKLWWNAYGKGAVPVVMGGGPGGRGDVARLLPPGSFLHVGDFAGPAELAARLRRLARRPAELGRLHAWRRRGYRVVQEHGYFGSASRHYCRLCEALNYGGPAPKVYRDLRRAWGIERECA